MLVVALLFGAPVGAAAASLPLPAAPDALGGPGPARLATLLGRTRVRFSRAHARPAAGSALYTELDLGSPYPYSRQSSLPIAFNDDGDVVGVQQFGSATGCLLYDGTQFTATPTPYESCIYTAISDLGPHGITYYLAGQGLGQTGTAQSAFVAHVTKGTLSFDSLRKFDGAFMTGVTPTGLYTGYEQVNFQNYDEPNEAGANARVQDYQIVPVVYDKGKLSLYPGCYVSIQSIGECYTAYDVAPSDDGHFLASGPLSFRSQPFPYTTYVLSDALTPALSLPLLATSGPMNDLVGISRYGVIGNAQSSGGVSAAYLFAVNNAAWVQLPTTPDACPSGQQALSINDSGEVLIQDCQGYWTWDPVSGLRQVSFPAVVTNKNTFVLFSLNNKGQILGDAGSSDPYQVDWIILNPDNGVVQTNQLRSRNVRPH